MKFKFKLKFDYSDSKLKITYRNYDEIYNIPKELEDYVRKLKLNGVNVFEEISKNEIKPKQKKEKISKNEINKDSKENTENEDKK